MPKKLLRCHDVMPGCPFEAHGTEEEILARAAEHATKDHGIQDLTPEIVAKVKSAIRDEA
jgi:predicted small metal-binding protein